MDHLTYLETYLDLTNKALGEIALLHGREDWTDAADAVTKLRADQDALWDRFRASAQQGVNP
jgi:hypothetical protein